MEFDVGLLGKLLVTLMYAVGFFEKIMCLPRPTDTPGRSASLFENVRSSSSRYPYHRT